MLFNSHLFLFIFFPLFLSNFYLIRFAKKEYQKNLGLFLIISFSVFFYAYWNLKYLTILFLSIFFNYYIYQLNFKKKTRYLKIIAAIFFNVGLLFYYKYFSSVFGFFNGNKIDFNSIVIPLGISFFTFQQLGYILDDKKKNKNIFEYASFVIFFPQLIAGPILKSEEYFPKIYNCIKNKKVLNNFFIGMVIFIIGLSKKLIIADQIAIFIDPYFYLNSEKIMVSLLESWLAAIGYIFQLYFDFSGYSDMAVGMCKCIGLNIPYNFNSPLKKKSIQSFWSTWHITLTRFTTSYIFNPMAIFLSRYNLKLNLILIISSMTTFILIGIWHGAGLNFLIFGLIHGVAYQINQFFSYLIIEYKITFLRKKYFDLFYWLITFTIIVVSFVFFRSPNLDVAINILSNMFNLSNLVLPNFFSNIPIFNLFDFKYDSFDFINDLSFAILLILSFVILIIFPNTKEIAELFEKNLMKGNKLNKSLKIKLGFFSLFIGVIFISSLFSLRNYNTFLYYQF